MALLWILGFGSFTLASLAIGVRLLLLARRTRQLPEAIVGSALVLGGSGYVPLVLAFHVAGSDTAPWLLALGNALLHAGALALAAGTARIFRPRERWPLVLFGALAAFLAISFGLRLAAFRTLPPPALVFWTSTLGGAAAYAWSATESLRFWVQMKRRAKLGLADAATTRRVALWGLCGVCAVGMHAASMIGRVVSGSAMSPGVVAVTSALGVVAALSLAVAFAPARARSAQRERATLES